MISNIQVLRGLAALAVVFYHTDFRIFKDVHTDFQGVSIFFVISGFIMTYILQKDTNQFMLRRIVRIVPLYWIMTITKYVVTLLMLIIHLKIHGNLSSLFYSEVLNSNTFWVILNSFLFLPYMDSVGNLLPYLGVGWTLNLEMFFYLLLAIMLMFSKKWTVVLACFIYNLILL